MARQNSIRYAARMLWSSTRRRRSIALSVDRAPRQDQGLGRDRVLAEDNAGPIVSIPNVDFHHGLLAPAWWGCKKRALLKFVWVQIG